MAKKTIETYQNNILVSTEIIDVPDQLPVAPEKTENPIAFTKDNTYDIGSPDDGSPRSVYASTSVEAPLYKITKFSSPASSAKGRPGEIRVDGDYLYLCVSLNTWKRTQLETY